MSKFGTPLTREVQVMPVEVITNYKCAIVGGSSRKLVHSALDSSGQTEDDSFMTEV